MLLSSADLLEIQVKKDMRSHLKQEIVLESEERMTKTKLRRRSFAWKRAFERLTSETVGRHVARKVSPTWRSFQ